MIKLESLILISLNAYSYSIYFSCLRRNSGFWDTQRAKWRQVTVFLPTTFGSKGTIKKRRTVLRHNRSPVSLLIPYIIKGLIFKHQQQVKTKKHKTVKQRRCSFINQTNFNSKAMPCMCFEYKTCLLTHVFCLAIAAANYSHSLFHGNKSPHEEHTKGDCLSVCLTYQDTLAAAKSGNEFRSCS